MAAYYPRKVVTFKDLQQAYPDLETWDEEEEDRLEAIRVYGHYPARIRRAADRYYRAKQKGKGAPKKKRTAERELP